MSRPSLYPPHPPLRFHTLRTEAGPVSIGLRGEEVCEVRLGEALGDTSGGKADPVAREALRQMRDYFRGTLERFELPVRLTAAPFSARVLAEVEAIPKGETRSYGDIARKVGRPRGARAVGQAVGRNPVPLIIPCHRVLASDGGLGGFGGGLEWKRFLLDLEGVSARSSRASRA